MKKRGTVETTIVSIRVSAQVQQNEDGSWTALIPHYHQYQKAVTAATKENALQKAVDAASAKYTAWTVVK